MADTATPTAVKKLLEKYNFHCRKSMGQNFLVDANIVNKIISSAGLEKDDVVCEIGPGLGVITGAAAEKAKAVVALELDSHLLPILAEALPGLSNVHIVAGDALTADFDGMVRSAAGHLGRYKLIANLPYSITTPLIMRLLKGGFNISLYVIMIQQEVAERITALPGGKDYGALSVAVQYYTGTEYLFRVPKTVFMPRPAVDSAVVRLVKRPKPAVAVPDQEMFFKVVRGSFGQRRKTLLNALGSAFDHMPKGKLEELLRAAGIDPRRRGETLNLSEFAGITREIYTFLMR
jgi:16S rRNA (adenine1518-N6/adenine1519-N6)-dimethyltransferase